MGFRFNRQIRVIFCHPKRYEKPAKAGFFIGLKVKAKSLIKILENNPLENSPPYEKLVGDLTGAYSKRINIQHCLVYQIDAAEKVVKTIRLWSDYE